MKLELDMAVKLDDGSVCELADVVVDPRTRAMTHVILSPRHRRHLSRLVPIGDLTVDEVGGATLRCSAADFEERYPYVESTAFVPMSEPITVEGDWEVGVQRVLAQPYVSTEYPEFDFDLDDRVEIAYDRIPKGRAEIRRSSAVHTADGKVAGRVDAFVLDSANRVTHVMLEKGHLWGRHDVAVPIGSVTSIDSDVITVGLTSGEIADLPHVPAVPHH